MIPRILQLVHSWLCNRIARKGKEIHDADILAHREKMIATGRLKLPYGKPTLQPPVITEYKKPYTPPTQPQLDITQTVQQQRQLIPARQVVKPTQTSIRLLASQYKLEHEMQLDAAKYLYHEIMGNGGLKPYANGYLAEEFKSNVPTWYRRNNGTTPDELAQMLGYDSDSDLYTAIANAEMKRQQLLANAHPYKFYLLQAAQDLHDELNPE